MKANAIGSKKVGATSGYIGVSASKNGKYEYWQVRIRTNKVLKYLGNYPKTKQGEIDAAIRYNQEALRLYGKDANLNKIR